jgi:RNA polymerase sigma factor (sigma-70 family)
MTGKELNALPDGELLRRVLADPHGEPGKRAASALLGRYQDRVYLWCFRLVRNHEQAMDLAQETLLNAYRRLESFGGRSAFSSWLFVIARNCCLSALRKRSPWWEDEDAAEQVASSEPGPDARREERFEEETVLALVRSHLDRIEQDALWLRCYEGLPVEEITKLLHIETTSGARGILQRARRKLRAALPVED